jgi:hypothetical protein
MLKRKFLLLTLPLIPLTTIPIILFTTSCNDPDIDANFIPESMLDIKANVLNGIKTEYQNADFSHYDSLYIPDNVTSVADNAFNQNDPFHKCPSFSNYIETINIQEPSSCISFGTKSFANLNAMTDVIIQGKSFTTFGIDCFQNSKNVSVMEMRISNVVTFGLNMLDGTSYNKDKDNNQGLFIFDNESIAKDYQKTLG